MFFIFCIHFVGEKWSSSTRAMDTFDTPLSELPGVGKRLVTVLKKEFQLSSYGDLLSFYPFRYEDRTQMRTIDQLPEYVDQYVQLHGRLTAWETQASFVRGRKIPLRATFSDETGSLQLVWFQGNAWIRKQYQLGKEYLLYGKLHKRGRSLVVPHPELTASTERSSKPGLIPIYRSTDLMRRSGVTSKKLAHLLRSLIPRLLPQVLEPFPSDFLESYALMPRRASVEQMHFPTTLTQAASARRRLCFEEFFFLRLHLRLRAEAQMKQSAGFLFKERHLMEDFALRHMPFELTAAQQRVIDTLSEDMRGGRAMNRLLQGDVGSGKTIVAWMSILIALSNGFQVAFMAPTEVLATQHAALLLSYAEAMDTSLEKLSSTTTKKARAALLARLASGQLKILVGTHALLEPDICFHRLGLVVIDEQHRFGVAQRAILSEKCRGPHPPHILVMTATPIPRTLALTQYGELETVVLDELPKGRKPIRTVHRTSGAAHRIYDFIKEQLNAGHRAYIVYPLIEESEHLDLSSLSEDYEQLERIFSDYKLEQLHGRMPAEEKRCRMQRFVDGEAQLLVSTTVIEVGIDVPQANLILIHHADRFGLAQLHQLRGRVGRGTASSYCILMTDTPISSEARTRIQAMLRTQNGFELAEVDLKTRGPGNMLGTQQSGLWRFEVADIVEDEEQLLEAQTALQKLLTQDPELKDPKHQSILEHLASLRIQQKDWMSF